MRLWVIVIACSFSLWGASLQAADQPRGELLELHSCQLYIGGCIASSEATQDGHYLLRVWSFSGGSYGDTALSGLTVALLEVSDQNLATRRAQPSEAMIYLPQSADSTQIGALHQWLKANDPELGHINLHTRTVPMRFARTSSAFSFVAGNFIAIETKPFEPCGLVSCGESLWYTPRSSMTSYTVGVTSKAVVCEPQLALRWIEHGKNNIFEGRFGEGAADSAAFIPPAFVCAVANHPPHE
jgi:Protein of unknown function (DUF1326)